MKREEKIADLVQRWIPDELRLDERHDAKLVSSAITTVIMAVYDSDRMTMVGQSGEVNAALKTWFDTTFSEHMRAEDDHMKGLEEKASRAMPVVSGITWEPYVEEDGVYEGITVGIYRFTDSRDTSPRFAIVSQHHEDGPDGKYTGATYFHASVHGDRTFRGKGKSPSEAFRAAVVNSGAMVKGDIP